MVDTVEWINKRRQIKLGLLCGSMLVIIGFLAWLLLYGFQVGFEHFLEKIVIGSW